MRTTVLNQCLRVTLSLIMVGMSLPKGYAQEEAVKKENIQIIKGDVYTYTASALTRVSVTDPDVADISDTKNDKILLLGKKPGQTVLFVWDADGKHIINISVVKEDLDIVKQRIDAILEKSGINGVDSTVDSLEGKVVLSGALSKENRTAYEKLIEPFNESILNLVKDETSQELIQIDMQIAEVSSTLSKNLGFDWGTATSAGPLASIDYLENFPALEGSKTWFKLGQFNRTASLVSKINILIQEGKAKDLSRPRILVTSGKEATINVGGEIPTQSTTTNAAGGSAQTNVTFKKYGVTLTVTPTIKNGQIDVVMNAEVSDVDKTFYSPASTNGTNEIAYKTRSAQTQLMLDDRQTVVFAGLIRYSESEQVKRVPFLGKLPIVGALFRNRFNEAPNEGKELIITLTPTIVRSKEYATDQIKMKTKKIEALEKEVQGKIGYEKEALPPLPAPKVKPSLSAQANENMTTTDYVRSVQQKIAKTISFPQEAMNDNVSGTVKLKLVIRKDGFLTSAAIDQSSGQKVFDEDALNTAKALVPYAPFPPSIAQEELTVTIPIVYSQTGT